MLTFMPAFFLPCDGHMSCYSFTEVVDDKFCPGFLLHIFTLLAVERNNINGVFQITKGGFDFLCELSHKKSYANPALIRTFVAETL